MDAISRGGTPELTQRDVALAAAGLDRIAFKVALFSLAGDAMDVPCDDAAKRELMTDQTFAWIRRQVEEHVGDLGNWLRATAT